VFRTHVSYGCCAEKDHAVDVNLRKSPFKHVKSAEISRKLRNLIREITNKINPWCDFPEIKRHARYGELTITCVHGDIENISSAGGYFRICFSRRAWSLGTFAALPAKIGLIRKARLQYLLFRSLLRMLRSFRVYRPVYLTIK